MDCSTRLHTISAYAWLFAWAATWTLAGLLGTGLGSPSLLMLHFAMGGLGFAGNLVLGMGHRIVTNAYARRMPSPRMLLAESGLLSTSALLLALTTNPFVAVPGRSLWLALAAWVLAAAALTAGVAAWIQYRAAPPLPMAAVCSGGHADRTSGILGVVALAYAVAAGLFSLRLGAAHPVVIHLWLLGFVTTAIFAVAHRVLPRFSTGPHRTRLYQTHAACAIVGPGLVVAAVWWSWTPWSAFGGLVALTAITLYTVMVLLAWRRRRMPGPVLPLTFAGAALLLLGATLGVHFLNHPELRIHIPVHAINNLIGFVGLTVVGMGAVMLGVGIRPVPGAVYRDVWWIGGSIAVALVAWEVAAYLESSMADALGSALGATVMAYAILGLRALRRPRPGRAASRAA